MIDEQGDRAVADPIGHAARQISARVDGIAGGGDAREDLDAFAAGEGMAGND